MPGGGTQRTHHEIGVYTILNSCNLPLAVICDTLMDDEWHCHQDEYCDGVDKHCIIWGFEQVHTGINLSKWANWSIWWSGGWLWILDIFYKVLWLVCIPRHDACQWEHWILANLLSIETFLPHTHYLVDCCLLEKFRGKSLTLITCLKIHIIEVPGSILTQIWVTGLCWSFIMGSSPRFSFVVLLCC